MDEYDTENWPDDETINRIYTIIGTELTDQCRKVMELRFVSGMTFSEVSEEIGISETAVYRHVRQALIIIRKNSAIMDKYDLVLDIIGNIDKYSPRQAEEILSGPEASEIYKVLCKTEASMSVSVDNPDVDIEWARFESRTRRNGFFSWFGNRAASIAVLAITTLAALAIGIAVTVHMAEQKSDSEATEIPGFTAYESEDEDKAASCPDTASERRTPVIFEDKPLREIIDEVSRQYSVTVEYESDKTPDLHLYYRFDPTLSLEEVIEQLNTFEQININIRDNKLKIK